MRRHLQIYGSAIVHTEVSESPHDEEQHRLVPCKRARGRQGAGRGGYDGCGNNIRHKASMMKENRDASMNRKDQQKRSAEKISGKDQQKRSAEKINRLTYG